jgi:hypothetical protein
MLFGYRVRRPFGVGSVPVTDGNNMPLREPLRGKQVSPSASML